MIFYDNRLKSRTFHRYQPVTQIAQNRGQNVRPCWYNINMNKITELSEMTDLARAYSLAYIVAAVGDGLAITEKVLDEVFEKATEKYPA